MRTDSEYISITREQMQIEAAAQRKRRASEVAERREAKRARTEAAEITRLDSLLGAMDELCMENLPGAFVKARELGPKCTPTASSPFVRPCP